MKTTTTTTTTTTTENRTEPSSSPWWSAAALASLTFLGGCSSRSDLLEARPDTSKPVASAGNDVSPLAKGKKEVSLADAPSNIVALNPDVSYLVRVPLGSYTEVRDSVKHNENMFGPRRAIDDVYVFIVPKDPSRYAVRFAINDGPNRYRGCLDPMDGAYLTLHDAISGELASAVKFPVYRHAGSRYDLSSGHPNHGKIAVIESAETGERFEVPTPQLLLSASRDDVQEAHARIYPAPEVSKL